MWETLLSSKFSQTSAVKCMMGKRSMLVQHHAQRPHTGVSFGQDAKSEASTSWWAMIAAAPAQRKKILDLKCSLYVLASTYAASVQAFDNVPEIAIMAAAEILQYMLHETPASICQRLAAHDADIAIIGRDQVVSDMPPHGHLRGQSCAVGDRTFDHGTRGVGGNPACPTCSVGAYCKRRLYSHW